MILLPVNKNLGIEQGQTMLIFRLTVNCLLRGLILLLHRFYHIITFCSLKEVSAWDMRPSSQLFFNLVCHDLSIITALISHPKCKNNFV